jgi:hypothetical protein
MLYYFATQRQWTYAETLAHTPCEIFNEIRRDRAASSDEGDNVASPAEIRRFMRSFRG